MRSSTDDSPPLAANESAASRTALAAAARRPVAGVTGRAPTRSPECSPAPRVPAVRWAPFVVCRGAALVAATFLVAVVRPAFFGAAAFVDALFVAAAFVGAAAFFGAAAFVDALFVAAALVGAAAFVAVVFAAAFLDADAAGPAGRAEVVSVECLSVMSERLPLSPRAVHRDLVRSC